MLTDYASFDLCEDRKYHIKQFQWCKHNGMWVVSLVVQFAEKCSNSLLLDVIDFCVFLVVVTVREYRQNGRTRLSSSAWKGPC